MNRRITFLAAAAGALLSCGDKIDAVQGTPCPAGQTASYETEIRPILEALCTGCHSAQLSGNARNGAPAAVNLDSFASAAKNADRANTRLQNETMPPVGSGASKAQKEAFSCWIAGGKQEKP